MLLRKIKAEGWSMKLAFFQGSIVGGGVCWYLSAFAGRKRLLLGQAKRWRLTNNRAKVELVWPCSTAFPNKAPLLGSPKIAQSLKM